MLIVNNSLPKSGGIWLNSSIHRMVPHVPVPKEWRRDDWSGASVHPDRLPEFVRKVNFRDKNIIMKTHYTVDCARYLKRPEIKIVIMMRNLLDVAVSRYHHLVRNGLSMERDEWLMSKGVDFVDGQRRGQEKWKRHAYVIHYEEMKNDPVRTLLALSEYLEHPHSTEKIESIVEQTQFDKMRARIGAHARSGQSGEGLRLPEPVREALEVAAGYRSAD